jgi:hypothetical protein
MWLVAIACQLITLAVWALLLPTYVAFLLAWLLLGVLLHAMKVMVISFVSNAWFQVWTQSHRHDEDFAVDTGALNRSLLHELLFETTPQLILQCINNSLLGYWSPVAYFSVIFSVAMEANSLYRFGYYLFIKNDPVPFAKMPIEVDFSIPFTGFKFQGFRIQPAHRSNADRDPVCATVVSTNQRVVPLCVASPV